MDEPLPKPPKLSDPPIRVALRMHIDQLLAGSLYRIKNEMAVVRGYGRIDLGVITEHELHGYEIKSDVDSFARLERQVECFGWVFDKMTLVTTEKKVTKATEKIPEWWGILLASPIDESVEISVVREAKANPDYGDRYVDWLSGLLWVDELIYANDFFNIKKSGTRNHFYLRKTLAEGCTIPQLRSIVCSTLLKRTKFDWSKNKPERPRPTVSERTEALERRKCQDESNQRRNAQRGRGLNESR